MKMKTIRKFGANTEYRELHHWVEQQLGKPSKCEACQTTTAKRYHWANISNQYYKNVSDWRRLCASCHRREHQRKDNCKYGHSLTIENTYNHPDGTRECRECRRLKHLISNAKSNLKVRER